MKTAAYFCIIMITITLTLIYGQSLIMPFVMGGLMWFIMRSLKEWINKIDLAKKYFPSWFKTILSSGIIVLLLMFLFQVLSNNIAELTQSYQKYESNITSVIDTINKTFNLNIIDITKQQMGDFDFGEVLSSVFSSLSALISSTFMIIIYALFILLEESNFKPKLKAVFNSAKDYEDFSIILTKIEGSISEYFRLKTVISLVTGVLSYIALRLIGVESPVFWAFLIFILNFIPTIGSLVGTTFPAIFALLQFGDLYPFLMVLIIVGSIQLLVGNVLEPRLMGSSMNISPLVTIIALSIWGAIWGIVGMVLSVPITVIIILVCSQFEKTKPIAILLSEKGKLV